MNDICNNAGALASRLQAVPHGFPTDRRGVGAGVPGDLETAELASQRLRFQRLWQILEQISRGTSLEEILNYIFEGFRGDIPFDRIAFATIDRSTGRVIARWARSEGELQIAPGYSQELAHSSLAQLVQAERPRIIDDLAAYLREHPESEGTAHLLAEGLRSSLTCPLVVEGLPIGFLFFNSKQPHAYSDSHVSFFVQLSAILAGLVERGRLFDELTKQRATVEDQRRLLSEENRRHREELALAQKVQRSLIHGSLPTPGRLRSEMIYEPAEMVGGDLVDCIGLGGDGALVYVADALGHGVPAALVMSAVRTAFHGALAAHPDPQPPSPATLLGEVNRTLMDLFDRQYVTAACARVDCDARTVTLALAGHPPVFLLHRGTGRVVTVAAPNIPLGIFGTTAYADIQVSYADGDVLLLYTDGVVEAEDAHDNSFGRDRLETMLARSGDNPIGTILNEIREALQRHLAGATPEDDITLLAVQL